MHARIATAPVRPGTANEVAAELRARAAEAFADLLLAAPTITAYDVLLVSIDRPLTRTADLLLARRHIS